MGATARPHRTTPEYAHADRTHANYPGPDGRRSGAYGRCPRGVLAPPTALSFLGRGTGNAGVSVHPCPQGTPMHATTPYKTAVHRLAIGRMLSVAGGEIAFVALMALVFGRTHSAVWGSAALLAVVGTYGLAAPFAGMLGDRFDRRIVMICSDTAGAVINVALVFAHAPTRAHRARGARGRSRSRRTCRRRRQPSRISCRPTSSCGRTRCARAPAISASCSARSPAACSSRRSAAPFAFAFNAVTLGELRGPRLERRRDVQRDDRREAARRPRRGLRLPLARPCAALDHGRLGADPGGRGRAAAYRSSRSPSCSARARSATAS